MTDPRPIAFCPHCGAEWRSALPLCGQCGATMAAPLEATVLRPVGFGPVTADASPFQLEATPLVATAEAALAPASAGAMAPSLAAAMTPAPAPALDSPVVALTPALDSPVVALTPAPTAAPDAPAVALTPAQQEALARHAAKKRRRRSKERGPEEQLLEAFGVSPQGDHTARPPMAAPAAFPPALTLAAPVQPWQVKLLADEPPPAAVGWGHSPHPAAAPPPGAFPAPPAMHRGGSAAKEAKGAEAAPKLSGLAVAGFILAFLCGPLGLLLSLIGFVQIKTSKGRLRGEWLAVAGVIISVLFLVIWSTATDKKSSKPRRAQVTVTLPVA
jgi:hypothetical protein